MFVTCFFLKKKKKLKRSSGPQPGLGSAGRVPFCTRNRFGTFAASFCNETSGSGAFRTARGPYTQRRQLDIVRDKAHGMCSSRI